MGRVTKDSGLCRATLALAAVFVAGCAMHDDVAKGAGPASVRRMYVFDCGRIEIKDLSRWSPPGSNVGKAFEFSDNCYLIQHAKGYMLWDSGVDYKPSISCATMQKMWRVVWSSFQPVGEQKTCMPMPVATWPWLMPTPVLFLLVPYWTFAPFRSLWPMLPWSP